MPLYDEKNKEGCSMTTQFPRNAQQEETQVVVASDSVRFSRRELYLDR